MFSLSALTNPLKIFTCAICVLSLAGLYSCDNNKQKIQRSVRDETLLLDGYKTLTFGTKLYTNDGEFKVDTVYTKNGEYLVTVDHMTYPQTHYDRLFSEDGRLLIGLSGCQECAVSGYAVLYDRTLVDDNDIANEADNVNEMGNGNNTQNGRIKGIRRTGNFEDAFPDFYWYKEDTPAYAQTLSNWYDELQDNEPDFQIIYNLEGVAIDVAGLKNPQNKMEGPIEFGIYEGDDFWVSDLHGGYLSFLSYFKDLDEDFNGVGLLYKDENLCAKLFYEHGQAVKYITYDPSKKVINENANPEGDIVGRILMEIELD